MSKHMTYLASGEKEYASVEGIFEEQEKTGMFYKFGELTATTGRLILKESCLFGWQEPVSYSYAKIAEVSKQKAKISFDDGTFLQMNWCRSGELNYFLDTIRLKAREAKIKMVQEEDNEDQTAYGG